MDSAPSPVPRPLRAPQERVRPDLLRPFHHQKLCDGTHAQKGRWFPLEYVLPILDHLEKEQEVFHVNCQTSAQDVIEYFNGIWAWPALS